MVTSGRNARVGTAAWIAGPAQRAGVVGREPELEAIRDFVGRLASGPGILVLEGEPGIGKTTLWQEGVQAARAQSWRVLTSCPAGSETRLSFAVLADLLEDELPEVLPGLPEPQKRALVVALLLESPEGRPPDQRTIGTALLSALRSLARSGPVVIAVDDGQWVDRPTAAVLGFAARRLREEPIGVLVALRAEGSESRSFALDWALPGGRLERLHVGPLSLGALHRLLNERLGESFSRPALRLLHETSGGNPFYALEFARALRRSDARADPGRALPVPSTLRELVHDRLAALDPRVRAVLRTVAALSSPTLTLMEEACEEETRGAVDAAVELRLIELEGERVRFVHPLLRSAVYSAIGPQQRRALHRRLAVVVVDPEERARHLALAAAGPDDSIAAELEAAARGAYGRGAPDAAAELVQQALRLTGPDRRGDRHRRMLAAADYLFEAGDADGATELLTEAVVSASPGSARAEALWRLGTVKGETEALPAASQLYRQALAEAEDPGLKALLHHGLARVIHLSEHVPSALVHAQAALDLSTELAEPSLLARALATMADLEFVLGHGMRSDLMDRALALEEQAEDLWLDDRPSTVLALQLVCVGHLDEARARLERLRRLAIERGDASLTTPLFYLSALECRAGNFELAARYAAETLELSQQSGRERASALFVVADAAAHLGKVEDARSQAAEAIALAERSGQAWFVILGLSVLGFVELSVGAAAEANRHLERASRLVARLGVAEPGFFTFLPDEIEALIALGRYDRARELVDEAETRARTLDRVGVLANLARCRALLDAAEGDFEGAFTAFREALEEHARLAMPFERARTLLALGSTQRRAKQKRAARESVQAALGIFEQLGAVCWADKARVELARIGGRPRGTGGLTPTEERVAALVSEGLSNKEVAAATFITTRTVEGHLSKIYAKLGVRSRTELAHYLSSGEKPSRHG